MKFKEKALKPRNIFLVLSILVILIITFISMVNLGQTYVMIDYTGKEHKASEIRIGDSNKGIVKVNDISTKKENIYYCTYVTFQSLKKGETTITVKYPDEASTVTHRLAVNSLGMIFEGETHLFSASNSFKVLFPSTILIILVITIYLCMKFREKRKNGEFSYSMVAIGGAILYCIGSIVSFLIVFSGSIIELLSQGGYGFGIFYFSNIPFLLSNLSDSGINFAVISCPILLIFAIAVSISNISLVRHEGFKPINLLGIISGLIYIAGFVILIMITTRDFSGSEAEYRIVSSINIALSFTFSYLVCMLLSTINCSFMATRYKLDYNQDYIIILGCAIRKDGTPTPILRARIDRAIEFEKKQFEATGKRAIFVPSGGQGSDEVVSEAECIKNYLIEQGYPEEQIIPENKSVNTLQNMRFSKKIIGEHEDDIENVNIAFSTTNYHVFRGYILAKSVGMKTKGLSAKTKLYFFPNAFVREFVGLLYEEKLRHALFILSIVILFILLMFFGT